MKLEVPGGSKEWTDSLPGAMHDDPEVIVTLVPDEAHLRTVEFEEHTLALIKLPSTGDFLGLQVLSPPLNEWQEHNNIMRRAGYQMANPVFIGLVSEIPQRVLLHEGMCPVFVLRHEMHRKFWNAKAWYLHSQGKKQCN